MRYTKLRDGTASQPDMSVCTCIRRTVI